MIIKLEPGQTLEEKMQEMKRKYEDRKVSLSRMKPGRINELGRSYGLPDDLNTSEMIKYILEKEFPSR